MPRERSVADVNNNQPRAIAHALAVLEEIATAGPGVTARDISERLQLSPATTYRILNLLVREEYVVRLGDLSGFALGGRVGALAEAHPAVGITRAVSAAMTEIRGRVGIAVHLFSVYGTRLRLLDEDARHPLVDRARSITDLNASAAGRLLLAEMDSDPDGDAQDRASTHERPTTVSLDASSPRGTSTIAVGVRGPALLLVNVIMAAGGRDYVAARREDITKELLRAADHLAPLLS
ncbi:MarR family transcriptional regulator [Labedella phragmitis]|uniref:MarR family transcriptional regulator n=1 Tax=Labedella phragmitis TaxID=2498849 RepID=A0A444PSG8_9MICO|nr:MarR family transcriptional regulator [Labedella phragmitis]